MSLVSDVVHAPDHQPRAFCKARFVLVGQPASSVGLVVNAKSHEMSYTAAVLAIYDHIKAGDGLTVQEVMVMTGRSQSAAYRMLCAASRRLPMMDTPVPGAQHRLWHRSDLTDDEIDRLLDRRA